MIPIQFITHRTERFDYEEGALCALEGGCRWVQLRMKDMPEAEVRATAIRLREHCDKYGAVMILDDYVALAKEVRADGVHLGKNDMPVAEARRLLGEAYIIGGTANTLEDCIALSDAGADYIGVGPFRFTTTKKNLSPVLGLEGYKSIMDGLRERALEIPVVAIGGIELFDVAEIMNTGVGGIALSGSILRSDNPQEMMKRFLEI